ncbi:DUF859 family phage minor structural protein [Listeria monocytogenes]
MATSGQIQTNTAFGYVRLAWSQSSQNIANNTTTISYTLSIYRSSNISSSASKSYSITINGVKVASGTTTIGGSGTKTIKTGSTTITHTADGSKSFSYSFSQEIDITWSGSSIGTITGSGTGTLNTIPRATTPTLSASSLDMGASITINTPRASTAFTHTLTYKFGNATGTIATGVTTSKAWTVPLSLANQVPNTTSGTCTITCKTYNGSTLIGTKTITFTAKVPSSVVPTISSVAVADTNSAYASQFGGLVQNKSKAKFTITAAGSYSSTISTYKTVIENKTYTGASPTTAILTGSGSITATITVTDSRGRTAKTTKTITVIAYKVPSITAFSIVRSNADGTENNEGTNATIKVAFSIAAVSNKNTNSYTIEYKLNTATTWTTLQSGSGYTYNNSIITNALFDTESTYDIRLTVSDYFGKAQSVIELSTAFTLMDFNANGKAMAFGKVSEIDEGVEFGIKAFFRNGEVPQGVIELQSGADLNSLIEVGYYVIGNTSISATILNKPEQLSGDTSTALVEVFPMGNGAQRVQNLYLASKTNQFKYQRIYYSGTWGDWFTVGGGTDWRNLSITGNFEVYGSGTTPKYRVNGHMVTITGAVKPTVAFMGNTTKVTFATGINVLYRPLQALTFVCQGSGINRWTLGVETDGSLTISRYGTTEFISVPVGAWLVFTVTYSI